MEIRIFLFFVICSVIIVNNIEAANDKKNELLDEWAIEINGGIDEAKKFANENDLKLVYKIWDSQNHYVFKLTHKRKRRMINAEHYKQFETSLSTNENVKWLQRQSRLSRKKRDFQINNKHSKRNTFLFTDPMWNSTWFLNRHSYSTKSDMNVISAWSQGFTGKGVSVTFLDDGLERDHPDLKKNYDPLASYDFNAHDDDPSPRYDDTDENKHGTRCAGEVGAEANNSVCTVGVAYNAGVGGIRMLDGDVTDSIEAASLGYNNNHVDIYSASWGPDDNGEVVDGPGPLAKKALEDGVLKGRNGKGSIFVWASGNGGRFGDSCSCDGYANSIYTMSISSTSENNEKPWYLEECTSTLATTYSSGDEKSGEQEISTTDIRHRCTTKHSGTSAAAPMAAGIIALTLEANSNLTWRDVMFLIILTSRPKVIKSNNFVPNKRGFLVSGRYGFGLMDAGRMTELAKTWINVPKMITCSTFNSKFKINKIQHSDQRIDVSQYSDGCEGTSDEVNYIEQVEIVLTINAKIRGAIEIYLTSPMGTRNIILPKRPKDMSAEGFRNWTFMSVQLWGESPKGDWKVEIIPMNEQIELGDFYIKIHGTNQEPLNYKSLVGMESVNVSKKQASMLFTLSNANKFEKTLFSNKIIFIAVIILMKNNFSS